ncbi:MAG: ribosome silencing factor [Candidatus Comchoanobacterales bacterium]
MLKNIIHIIEQTLQDHKAEEIQILPVGHLTSFTEYIIIATATSKRHILALHGYLKASLKNEIKLTRPNDPSDNWLAIDLDNIIVHLMTQETRHYYRIESLWLSDH